MNSIFERVGEAAVLELLAEECSELAQAALKLARKKRGENPTPKTEAECIADLIEEMADVDLCRKVLEDADWWDQLSLIDMYNKKMKRWQHRLDGVK